MDFTCMLALGSAQILRAWCLNECTRTNTQNTKGIHVEVLSWLRWRIEEVSTWRSAPRCLFVAVLVVRFAAACTVVLEPGGKVSKPAKHKIAGR